MIYLFTVFFFLVRTLFFFLDNASSRFFFDFIGAVNQKIHILGGQETIDFE